METKSIDEAFHNLNEQLMSVERTSRSLTAKLEDLSWEAEGLKLEFSNVDSRIRGFLSPDC